MPINIVKALRSPAFLCPSLSDFTQNDFYGWNSFIMETFFFFYQTTFSRLWHSTEHFVAIGNLQMYAYRTKSHDKQMRRSWVKRVGRKRSGTSFRAPAHLRHHSHGAAGRKQKSWSVEIIAASRALWVKVHTPRHPCYCCKTSWSPETFSPWLP